MQLNYMQSSPIQCGEKMIPRAFPLKANLKSRMNALNASMNFARLCLQLLAPRL